MGHRNGVNVALFRVYTCRFDNLVPNGNSEKILSFCQLAQYLICEEDRNLASYCKQEIWVLKFGKLFFTNVRFRSWSSKPLSINMGINFALILSKFHPNPTNFVKKMFAKRCGCIPSFYDIGCGVAGISLNPTYNHFCWHRFRSSFIC